ARNNKLVSSLSVGGGGVMVMILRLVLLGIIGRFMVESSTSTSSSSSILITQSSRGGASSASVEVREDIDDDDNIDGRTTSDDGDSDMLIATSTSRNVSSSNVTDEGSSSINNIIMDDHEDDDDNNRRQVSKRRKLFLNRIAKVSSLLLRREHDALLDEEEEEGLYELHDAQWGNEVTPQSDLTRPGRHIHIVTTAALPWFTGTAVNPLLRAAYLHKRLKEINKNAAATNTNTTSGAAGSDDNKSSYVTLVIPWLELPEDQEQVYHGKVFATPQEQELYVRDWLRNQAGMPDAADHLNLVFYNARYHAGLGSVFAMGDIIQQLPQDELDVCILEEPEHVNWFRAPGQGWTKRYNYVVGIVHTNYDQYATQHYSGLWTAPAIRLMSAAMIRAYCHKVIKLSDVVQVFAPEKELTMNVHGVREEFIATPNNSKLTFLETTPTTYDHKNDDKNHSQASPAATANEKAPVYFIGKLLWTKGLDLLLDYEEYYRQVTGEYFPVEIYGSGPDEKEMVRAYLGRWTTTTQEEDDDDYDKQRDLEKASSLSSRNNLFVRLFAWMNKRRRGVLRTGGTRKRQQRQVLSEDIIYKDVLDVIDAFPEKARESLQSFPTQARESLDQLSEDMSKAKRSVRRLPKKAKRALNRLVGDLSNTPLPRSLHELRKKPIPAGFPGRVDHAELKDHHKIFVNPSVSEVLCTTTAEALAMNKFAIIPVHPSNQFFLQFPNCLAYRNPYEFVANLKWALTHDPVPLSEEQAREFTWEAATDRLLQSASITHREAHEREMLGRSKMDERIAWFHNELGKGIKGDIIRNIFGAGPVSGQVKYSTETQQDVPSKGDINEEDEEEADEGLSRKFHDSAFVKAIREALVSGISTASE
ncbi:MAG: hypothetical protein SGILL_005982, partial [Bacillariaceae sp.]